jgi:hypothetical protein
VNVIDLQHEPLLIPERFEATLLASQRATQVDQAPAYAVDPNRRQRWITHDKPLVRRLSVGPSAMLRTVIRTRSQKLGRVNAKKKSQSPLDVRVTAAALPEAQFLQNLADGAAVSRRGFEDLGRVSDSR